MVKDFGMVGSDPSFGVCLAKLSRLLPHATPKHLPDHCEHMFHLNQAIGALLPAYTPQIWIR